MRQIRYLRLFSVKRKLTFHILVASLAFFSVGAWWAVKSAVSANLHSRLEAQADRIEAIYTHELAMDFMALKNVKGHLKEHSPNQARRFIQNLDLPTFASGFNGIGQLTLPPGYFAAQNSTPGPHHPAELSPSAILFEAHDTSSSPQLIANQLVSTAENQRTLQRSLQSGEPGLLHWSTYAPLKSEIAHFAVVLPITKNVAALAEHGAKLDTPSTFLFMPFKAKEFFDAAFGSPSLKKEKVNFSVMDLSSGQPQELYNRFDLTAKLPGSIMELPFYGGRHGSFDPASSAIRTVDIFNQKLRLVISPLPGFFTFSDQNLPVAVGFGAAFISILILLGLKASQEQILYESRARELSLQAAHRSQLQTELLQKLNEAARGLSFELNLASLTQRFFNSACQLVKTDFAFYYSSDDGLGAPLQTPTGRLRDGQANLVHVYNGASEHERVNLCSTLKNSLNPQVDFVKQKTWLTSQPLTQKSNRGSSSFLFSLFGLSDVFVDWLLFVVPAQDGQNGGLLFLAREAGVPYDAMNIEILQSFVAHAASAMQNARLFQKVDEASRAKNSFLANMSHEIRTPLNAIIGYSDMLQEFARDPQPITAPSTTNLFPARLGQQLKTSTEQLTELIDDILDLSKIEAGKLEISNQLFALAPFLDEIKFSQDAKARKKGLRFSVESTGKLPEQVSTDPLRLKQILINLIGNAVKFTERGTVLLHVSLTPKGDLAFRVRDTGIGISKENQRVLFLPFSQGDTSTTRKFGGTGLGLALARRLARELGGDLELIESFPERGSVFEARIALRTSELTNLKNRLFESRTKSGEGQIPPPRLDGKNILLVEDSIDNQQIFRFFLEASGAEIEIADNGLEAVNKAGASHHDLILMDIQIPEIDGKEATRRIRHQGFKLPIVALTAHAMEQERRSCIEAGCDGQITKPVSAKHLVAEVARYMGVAQ